MRPTSDSDRAIRAECEADARACEEAGPWDGWSDEEFADLERQVNAATAERYADRLRACEAGGDDGYPF
jgi:hypothetical protein